MPTADFTRLTDRRPTSRVMTSGSHWSRHDHARSDCSNAGWRGVAPLCPIQSAPSVSDCRDQPRSLQTDYPMAARSRARPAPPWWTGNASAHRVKASRRTTGNTRDLHHLYTRSGSACSGACSSTMSCLMLRTRKPPTATNAASISNPYW